MSEHSATCPICSSPRTEIRFRLSSVIIRSCQSCGHHFQYPVPSQEVLDGIFAALYSGDMDLIDRYFPEWKKFYTGSAAERAEVRCPKMLRRRLRLAERFTGPGRLLDVGCGFGQFLQVAGSSGWEIGGVEPSPPAAEYIKNNLGVEVYEKTSDDLSEYQLITLWDVVEHQSSPREFLEEIARTICSGAVVAITVPNQRCLLTWLAEFIWKISGGKIDGPLRKFYFISHLQYFTRRSLCVLLKNTGFDILLETGEDTCLDNLDMGWGAKTLLRVIFIISRLFGPRNRLLIYAIKQ
ncbi:MAG TPA: methyltransferase domain-containing protein [Proteobacteria bacterium]|nr:methyltransferase domain-containing protein [Pseudomonadota bacterium]